MYVNVRAKCYSYVRSLGCNNETQTIEPLFVISNESNIVTAAALSSNYLILVPIRTLLNVERNIFMKIDEKLKNLNVKRKKRMSATLVSLRINFVDINDIYLPYVCRSVTTSR